MELAFTPDLQRGIGLPRAERPSKTFQALEIGLGRLGRLARLGRAGLYYLTPVKSPRFLA